MKTYFNPLVSIIVPVYNGSVYMQEAINSALAQTYKNIEIIVINDGSTDSTEKIAKSYGDKIRYYSKKNGGVSSALNLALREMRGKYFSWLSHDDAYYPDKIKKQVEFLSKLKNKNIILYSDYDLVDDKSQLIITVRLDHSMLKAKPEYALFRSAINGCTLLIPKKAFNEYGFFDEKLKCTQDYAKWFEMMKSYNLVHIPKVLIKYRLHNLQDTSKNPLVANEGDVLWTDMMKRLSIEDKIRLEGSEYNFYKEMEKFLIETPYKKTEKFSKDMMQRIVRKSKENKLAISIIVHSSGKYDARRAMLNIIDVLLKNNIFVHVILLGDGPIEQGLIKRNVIYDKVSIQRWANTESDVDDMKEKINDNAIELALILGKINPNIIYTNTSVISEGAIAAKILDIPHTWNIAEFGGEEHGIKYFIDHKEKITKYGKNGYNFTEEKFNKEIFGKRLLNKLYSLKGRRKNNASREALYKVLGGINLKNKKLVDLENTIQQKDQEVELIKSSKFWKLRKKYIKIKKFFKI